MTIVLVCSCPNACCSKKDVHVSAVNSLCFEGRHVGGVLRCQEEEDEDEEEGCRSLPMLPWNQASLVLALSETQIEPKFKLRHGVPH